MLPLGRGEEHAHVFRKELSLSKDHQYNQLLLSTFPHTSMASTNYKFPAAPVLPPHPQMSFIFLPPSTRSPTYLSK